MLRKIFTALICFAMLFSLSACTSGSKTTTENSHKRNSHNGSRLNETVSKPVISLGYAEASRLFEREYENFEMLISDVSDAVEYYSENDFDTIEDIRKYEAIWQDMADRAAAIQTELLEKKPPLEYEEVWNSFAECLEKMSNTFAKGTNLDANSDNNYNGDEIVYLLYEIGNEFADNAYEAINLTNELVEITKSIDVSSANTSSTTFNNTSKYTCIICGKTASHTITNTFSDKLEHYCETHYQEIFDIIGMLAEDLRSSD